MIAFSFFYKKIKKITVFKNVEKMKGLGLDVPQATELAYRLRKKGFKLPDNILDENECAEAILKILEVKK